MNELIQSRWLPIVLLTCSNVFIVFAGLHSAGFQRTFNAARLKQ